MAQEHFSPSELKRHSVEERKQVFDNLRRDYGAISIGFVEGPDPLDGLDAVTDVELGQLRPGFLGQRPKALDHVARPIAILDDCLHRSARLFQVGSLAAKPAQAGLGVGDDGGERLSDLMRKRGGHAALALFFLVETQPFQLLLSVWRPKSSCNK